MVSRLDFAVNPGAPQVAEVCTGGRVERLPFDALPRVNLRDDLAPGEYVGVYPHGLAGGGAQVAVSGKLTATLSTLKAGARFASQFFLTVPARWRKGDSFDFSLLYTTGGSVPHRPASDYQAVVTFLGLRDGRFPAIRHVAGGRLLKNPVIPTIETEAQGTVRIEAAPGPADPIGLPLRLRGFVPGWQLAYRLNEEKVWRYCGRLDADSYLRLHTTRGAATIVAGHPVWADRQEVILALDDPAGRQMAFEVYNPTAQALKTVLRTNPAFLPEQTLAVELAPFTSERVTFRGP
jgi:hypothetical protein